MANRSILKGYFVSKAKPTSTQFATMIDSLVHQDDIAALTLNFEYTATANFSKAFAPKSTLEKLAIVPTADIILSIGTAPGGTDILDSVNILSINTDLFVLEKYFHAGATLYFTGITSTTYIKFFQRT